MSLHNKWCACNESLFLHLHDGTIPGNPVIAEAPESEGRSADQLSVAMMSEARRLQKDVGLGRLAMAERLGQWAGDVRKLGERLANVESGYDTTAHVTRTRAALDKLVRIQELCDSKIGSLYDDDIQDIAKEVLEIINE